MAPIDSKTPLSMLPRYSPWNCFMISKKTFCMKTVSVGRLRAQAKAYFSTSASSWSLGTTLLRKLQSYISAAVKARPVNTISWNLRMPMVCAHHHMRGPQP